MLGKGTASCVDARSGLLADIEDISPRRARDHNSRALRFTYVEDDRTLQREIDKLWKQDPDVMALDIETTGLQPWSSTIRLVQIGVETPRPRQVIIDCWAADARPAMELLAERAELVTCNGEFEQRHLGYHYGLWLEDVFDLCYASRVINQAQGRKLKNSYAALMRRHVGKRISKTQQVSAWNAEKLSNAQLRYAAMDVAGSLDIRVPLGQKIRQAGLLEEARAFTELKLEAARVSAEAYRDLDTSGYMQMSRAFAHAQTLEELKELHGIDRRMNISGPLRDDLAAEWEQRRRELAGEVPVTPAGHDVD